MQTDVITYNLKDRGRVYRGQPRNFDTKRIAAHINSPEMQERVKNRDLVGYYGHWPRQAFGLNPTEGGLKKGKPALVEPAIVTTLLEADANGTIRHQAEFLQTEAGRVSMKLHESRTGGFSSAIDTRENRFYGFDYVLEPNFTTNRGYALDSVSDMDEEQVFDAVMGEYMDAMQVLLDSANDRAQFQRDQYELLELTLKRTQAENQELMSMLAKAGNGEVPVFDSVLGAFSRDNQPLRTSAQATDRFALDCANFPTEDLKFKQGQSKPKPKRKADSNRLPLHWLG